MIDDYSDDNLLRGSNNTFVRDAVSALKLNLRCQKLLGWSGW